MKLELINKDWITAEEFAAGIGIKPKLAKLVLQNSVFFWTMRRKTIKGVVYYGTSSTGVKKLELEIMFRV